jgi:hypothetical protein
MLDNVLSQERECISGNWVSLVDDFKRKLLIVDHGYRSLRGAKLVERVCSFKVGSLRLDASSLKYNFKCFKYMTKRSVVLLFRLQRSILVIAKAVPSMEAKARRPARWRFSIMCIEYINVSSSHDCRQQQQDIYV